MLSCNKQVILWFYVRMEEKDNPLTNPRGRRTNHTITFAYSIDKLTGIELNIWRVITSNFIFYIIYVYMYIYMYICIYIYIYIYIA